MKKIILISGKLRSGKNTSAEFIMDYLKENNKSYKHLYFAKPLKNACKEDFQNLKEYLKDFPELSFEDENFDEEKTKLTRILLQIYGTNIFRKRVGINYWVDKVLEEIKTTKEEYIIFTDVRFPNEIDYLIENLNTITGERKYITYTIRVERPMDRDDSVNEHESETALDDYKRWSSKINNIKDLEYLKEISTDIIKGIVNV